MLWKILLPLMALVVAVVWGMARRSAPTRRVVYAPAPATVQPAPRRGPRVPAWALVIGGAMVLALVWHFTTQWLHDRELVRVRVVDIRTGQTQVYDSTRKQVRLRGFDTLDGRRIQLADVERMEIEPLDK